MIKKTVTYTDYNGVERTEDFYFNLTKAELMRMELTTPGGFSTMLKNIVDSKDNQALVKMFEKLILASYGKKSEDGKRFIKSQEITDELTQSEAYSDLFMQLISDEKAAADFVNGIIPQDLVGKQEIEPNDVLTDGTE